MVGTAGWTLWQRWWRLSYYMWNYPTVTVCLIHFWLFFQLLVLWLVYKHSLLVFNSSVSCMIRLRKAAFTYLYTLQILEVDIYQRRKNLTLLKYMLCYVKTTQHVICLFSQLSYCFRACSEGFTCYQAGPNPNWGFTHFDNFPWAVLNTFQLVTLDFWEDTYNKVEILRPIL